MTTDATNEQQAISDYIATLDLTYTATFQPTPQPAKTVPYPQLHWLVTLCRGNGHTMSFAYHEGSGHVKGYEKLPGGTPYDRRIRDEAVRRTCETGTCPKIFRRGCNSPARKNQPAPELIDVLYSLVSDSEVLNHANFEAWASEYGYDPDSLKEERTYQQCLRQSLALANMTGRDALEQLRELYHNY